MSPFPITKTCGHARPRIEWGWIYDPKLAELDEMQFYVVQLAPNGKIYRHLAICANSDLRLRLGVRGPFAGSEAAARELIRICKTEMEQASRSFAYTGTVNFAFIYDAAD